MSLFNPEGVFSEYSDVYDAFTAKPSGMANDVFNSMVGDIVNAGSWAKADVFQFYSTHTNDNGEAQLNWIYPTGEGSLLDSGKGSFAVGTEGWGAYGANTIENDSGALKITYVNNGGGAYDNLNSAGDLSEDLGSNKTYKLRVRIKIGSGSADFRVYDKAGNLAVNDTFTNTAYAWKEYVFNASSGASVPIMRFASFDAGEIIWIDQWDIQVWTGAVKAETPLWEQYKGFTGVLAPRAYMKCSYTPSLNAVNYALNNATVIVGTESFEADAAEFGSNDASSHETRINSYVDPGGGVRVSINCLTGSLVAGTLGGIGHAGGTRNNATQISIWQNTSSQVVAQNSTQLPEREFYACTSNISGVSEYMNKQIRYVWISSALTNTEYIKTVNAIETCLRSFGSGLI